MKVVSRALVVVAALADSDSGTYFAGGTLIGSTLSNQFGDVSKTATAGATSVRRASILPGVER